MLTLTGKQEISIFIKNTLPSKNKVENVSLNQFWTNNFNTLTMLQPNSILISLFNINCASVMNLLTRLFFGS